MSEFEQTPEEEFSNKLKEELREIGLIKQEEKIKVIKNTKGYNFEITLLGKVEENFERTSKAVEELNKRLK